MEDKDSHFESISTDRRFSLLEDRLKRTEQALLEKNSEIAKLQLDNRRLSLAVLGKTPLKERNALAKQEPIRPTPRKPNKEVLTAPITNKKKAPVDQENARQANRSHPNKKSPEKAPVTQSTPQSMPPSEPKDTQLKTQSAPAPSVVAPSDKPVENALQQPAIIVENKPTPSTGSVFNRLAAPQGKGPIAKPNATARAKPTQPQVKPTTNTNAQTTARTQPSVQSRQSLSNNATLNRPSTTTSNVQRTVPPAKSTSQQQLGAPRTNTTPRPITTAPIPSAPKEIKLQPGEASEIQRATQSTSVTSSKGPLHQVRPVTAPQTTQKAINAAKKLQASKLQTMQQPMQKLNSQPSNYASKGVLVQPVIPPIALKPNNSSEVATMKPAESDVKPLTTNNNSNLKRTPQKQQNATPKKNATNTPNNSNRSQPTPHKNSPRPQSPTNNSHSNFSQKPTPLTPSTPSQQSHSQSRSHTPYSANRPTRQQYQQQQQGGKSKSATPAKTPSKKSVVVAALPSGSPSTVSTSAAVNSTPSTRSPALQKSVGFVSQATVDNMTFEVEQEQWDSEPVQPLADVNNKPEEFVAEPRVEEHEIEAEKQPEPETSEPSVEQAIVIEEVKKEQEQQEVFETIEAEIARNSSVIPEEKEDIEPAAEAKDDEVQSPEESQVEPAPVQPEAIAQTSVKACKHKCKNRMVCKHACCKY